MREIRVAVVGIGNCASSLIQGLQLLLKKTKRNHRADAL